MIATLSHHDGDRRVMAVQVLGKRKSIKALPAFEKILSNGTMDIPFLKEILTAVYRIGQPQGRTILEKAAKSDSAYTRHLAEELIEEWDRSKEKK